MFKKVSIFLSFIAIYPNLCHAMDQDDQSKGTTISQKTDSEVVKTLSSDEIRRDTIRKKYEVLYRQQNYSFSLEMDRLAECESPEAEEWLQIMFDIIEGDERDTARMIAAGEDYLNSKATPKK